MKLLKTKEWAWIDIGLLKFCCILIGMIGGAYLADFTKEHIVIIAIAAILLGIKPAIAYFRSDSE